MPSGYNLLYAGDTRTVKCDTVAYKNLGRPEGRPVLQVLEVWKTKAVVRWIRFRDGQHHVELWVSQQMTLLYFGMLV